eukprot:scaffold3508_cov113-Cylindrotheca_fusiformis.AAC.4
MVVVAIEMSVYDEIFSWIVVISSVINPVLRIIDNVPGHFCKNQSPFVSFKGMFICIPHVFEDSSPEM